MKRLLCIALLSLTLQGCCTDGNCNDDEGGILSIVSNYDPVIMDRATFEESVTLQETQPLFNTGKIYVISGLLFVNEKNQGFHIYDNSNPSNPRAIAFIAAPGATDLAIKNGVYFINQAVDLIAVTYTSETNVLQVTKRIRNVFPVKISPDGYIPSIADTSVITDYTLIN